MLRNVTIHSATKKLPMGEAVLVTITYFINSNYPHKKDPYGGVKAAHFSLYKCKVVYSLQALYVIELLIVCATDRAIFFP